MHTKKAAKYVGKKGMSCRFNRALPTGNKGIRPHVSGGISDQSTQFEHLSHLDSHYCSRSQEITNPSSVDYV
jgi:hypothetical protein